MQINITDELIEQMVREQVKARVNSYFGQLKKEDDYYLLRSEIKNTIRDEVEKKVDGIFNTGYADKVFSELLKNDLKDTIIDLFIEKMRGAFEEDY